MEQRRRVERCQRLRNRNEMHCTLVFLESTSRSVFTVAALDSGMKEARSMLEKLHHFAKVTSFGSRVPERRRVTYMPYIRNRWTKCWAFCQNSVGYGYIYIYMYIKLKTAHNVLTISCPGSIWCWATCSKVGSTPHQYNFSLLGYGAHVGDAYTMNDYGERQQLRTTYSFVTPSKCFFFSR